MLYARPTLNAKHGVRFGLRHIRKVPHTLDLQSSNQIDVLNRYPLTGPENTNDHVDAVSGLPERNTILVMMYIFPRQFGLHNVFTSDVDPRQTVQPFQDYTLRKDEINKNFPPPMSSKIPKRLRGRAASLVQKLQIQHSRCPYKKLLEHYCPVSLDL
jgi:telomerase reverse transcriptase